MKYIRIESSIYTYTNDLSEKHIRKILKEMTNETKGFYSDEFLEEHGLYRTFTFIEPKFEFQFEYRRKRWERVG